MEDETSQGEYEEMYGLVNHLFDIGESEKAERVAMKVTIPWTKEEIKDNRFYVGSQRVFRQNWGHSTVEEAIQHGRELMDEQGEDEAFIVQIIRVLRRKPTPVIVQVVPGERTVVTANLGRAKRKIRRRK